MKNKVAEMFGVMIKSERAERYFQNGWNALYNDLMADPIKAMKKGEENDFLNTLCAMALVGWYDKKNA